MTQPLFSMVIAVVRPTPPGHCGRCRGSLANSVVFVVDGIVVDDGGAGPLQVRHVVEIVDQHVVLLDLAGGDRRHDDGVGVLVAVVRHGRGQRDVLVDGLEEAARSRRRAAATRRERHGAMRPCSAASPARDQRIGCPSLRVMLAFDAHGEVGATEMRMSRIIVMPGDGQGRSVPCVPSSHPQNRMLVRTPSTSSLPIRWPGAFGLAMPPPGLNTYWKSGWSCTRASTWYW